MGYPLRSNIFRQGSHEQREFLRFPVQVMVFHSPRDRTFGDALRRMFLDLDRLTAEHVAFFAVLDPPRDWLDHASEREWTRRYWTEYRTGSYTLDDRPLVNELARLFGVEWDSFPCLVVGPDLWAGELVTIETDASLLERQLAALTQLVQEVGQPAASHIEDVLETVSGASADVQRGSLERGRRVQRVYRILETGPRGVNRDPQEFERQVADELRIVERTLSTTRRASEAYDRDSEERLRPFADAIEDAVGRLVAPSAAVAGRADDRGEPDIFRELRLGMERSEDVLDESSAVLLEEGLLIRRFLSAVTGETVAVRWPSESRFQSLGTRFPPDYSPAAQGVWKAFETEINLSVVQAARSARSVPMPQCFALYDTHLPRKKGLVETPRNVDINEREGANSANQRHRFLMLGPALKVAQVMDQKEPDFGRILGYAGFSLDPALFDTWQRINHLCNKGSHVEPLSAPECDNIWRLVLDSGIMGRLCALKAYLRRNP